MSIAVACLAPKMCIRDSFTALQIAWEVQDADGKKVEDYAGAVGAATYGKIAYVASVKLNGFDNGIDTNWTGGDDAEANTAWLTSPYTGETCTLTIAQTNPSELATEQDLTFSYSLFRQICTLLLRALLL